MWANDVSDVHSSISNLSCVIGSSSVGPVGFVFEVFSSKYHDIVRLWIQARKGTHLTGGEF